MNNFVYKDETNVWCYNPNNNPKHANNCACCKYNRHVTGLYDTIATEVAQSLEDELLLEANSKLTES